MSALALGGFALCPPGVPIAVLYAVMVVFGTGLGLGLGNEMLLVYASVERRDLGVATTGIRFVETLGTSLGATAFATLFSALVPDGATAAQDVRRARSHLRHRRRRHGRRHRGGAHPPARGLPP